MEQLIEMTINRSCKEIGGFSGKIENVGASERWAKIHRHMEAMREHLNEKVRKNIRDANIELGALRMERDERNVQMILKCLKNWTPNMWHSHQPISNIATGKIATETISKNTLSLKDTMTPSNG